MAISSKYIQLSRTVLLEYIYSDQSEINTPGNQWRIDTDDTPIWILKNEYTNQTQILNADSAKSIENNVPTNTGNVRDRSFAVISSHRGALLKTQGKTVFYNDFDSKLTKTSELPLIISNRTPIYDRVRIHMVQGFDFESNVGYVLSLKFKDKNNNDLVLSNFVYLKEDSWETNNPSAFFFGGRVYNTYVEFKVLSLYNLIDDYWLKGGNERDFVERITSDIGIKENQFIQVYFSFIKEKTTVNGQDYIDLINVQSVDLPIRDQFEKISAFIKESDSFDYIEYYASFGGEIINPYITMLNNSGGDYMIIHELNVSEFVYDPSTGNYDWVYIDKLQNIQDSEFGRVNTYRPIIKNSGSISFKIDYIVRLFNKNDGSQVWKQSSLISNNVNKYGKKLKSINITENIIKAKIYNQSIVKEISMAKLPEKYISDTKYITSLFNVINVSVSSSSYSEINNDSSNIDSFLPEKIYDNGLGIIHIPNSVCFIQFNVYEKTNNVGGYTLRNLSGFEDFEIVFVDGTMEDYYIPEYPDPNSEKIKGQLTFKFSKEQTSKILSFSNKTFTIYQKNKLGEKTYLYSGKFYSTDEINKIIELEKISKLELEISDLNNRLNIANSNIILQQNQIKELNDELLSISASNTNLTRKIAETDPNAALELLRKENTLLQSKLSNSNNNAATALINAIKNGSLINITATQGRGKSSDLWQLDNTSTNKSSISLAEETLRAKSSANLRANNYSGYNPRTD